MKENLEKIYAGLEEYSREAEKFGGVICRLVGENAKDFSDSELHRVFDGCVVPAICISRAKELQKQYGI